MAIVGILGGWQVKRDSSASGLKLDGTGVALMLDLDNSTIELSGNTARVKDGGIATAKLANNAVTPAKADLTQIWTFAADKLQISSDASGASDPVRKSQMDAFAQGLRVKETVRLATNAALPSYTHTGGVLTATSNGALSIDGVATQAGDRVLVKDETGGNAKYNGWFDVTDSGDGSNPFILTRSADANIASELASGSFSYVKAGTANINTRWAVTGAGAPTTLGTDDVAFTSLGAAFTAGDGLTSSGTTVDIVADDDSIVVLPDSIAVKLDSAGAIEINAGQGIRVKLNGSTLNSSSSGLKVATGGITATELGTKAATSGKVAVRHVGNETLTGNASNGVNFTIPNSGAIISGWEEETEVYEDGVRLFYTSSSTPGNNEFTNTDANTIKLGHTQAAVEYRILFAKDT